MAIYNAHAQDYALCNLSIEIRGVENGNLAVPVNNTLVCHMAFLAADT